MIGAARSGAGTGGPSALGRRACARPLVHELMLNRDSCHMGTVAFIRGQGRSIRARLSLRRRRPSSFAPLFFLCLALSRRRLGSLGVLAAQARSLTTSVAVLEFLLAFTLVVADF